VRILCFLISQTSTTLVAKRVLTKATFSCAIDLNKLILLEMCYDWSKANYLKKGELIWIVKEIQPLYLSCTYLVRPVNQAFLNRWNEVHEHFCHKKLNINQKRKYGRVGSSRGNLQQWRNPRENGINEVGCCFVVRNSLSVFVLNFFKRIVFVEKAVWDNQLSEPLESTSIKQIYSSCSVVIPIFVCTTRDLKHGQERPLCNRPYLNT